MKHKIVFRGKSLDNNKWYNGDLRQFSDGKVFIAYKNFAMVRVNIDSVGQYTGLKDKNGKEIYEGDVVNVGPCVGVVVWDEDAGGFYLKEDGAKYHCAQSLGETLRCFESVIIGNIHEQVWQERLNLKDE